MSIGPRVAMLTVVLLWIRPGFASAQEEAQTRRPDLERSRRVRVTPVDQGARTAGEVLGSTPDSPVLVTGGGVFGEPSRAAFAWKEIRDVERSLGRMGHAREGAYLAGIAGSWTMVESEMFPPILPIAEAGLGLVLGALYRPERWEALPREPLEGDRVPVDCRAAGLFRGFEGDTLLVDEEGAQEFRKIPGGDLSTLERSLGTRHNALRGGVYGVALGLGALFADPPYNWGAPAAGAVAGLVVGALIETERWGPLVMPERRR